MSRRSNKTRRQTLKTERMKQHQSEQWLRMKETLVTVRQSKTVLSCQQSAFGKLV